MTEVNNLLLEQNPKVIESQIIDQNPKVIESQIIDYIMSLREDGIAYKTIQFLTTPIFTFYQLNDIILNRKKISWYLGEYKKIVINQRGSTCKDVDPFA
jgi:hypothetical protein